MRCYRFSRDFHSGTDVAVAVDVASAVVEAGQIVAASRGSGIQTAVPAGCAVRTTAVVVEVAQIADWGLGVGYKCPVHRKQAAVVDGWVGVDSSPFGLQGHHGQSHRYSYRG